MKAELFQPVMGDDLSVVNAARVSFSKQSDWEYENIVTGYDDCSLGQISLNKRVKKLADKDVNLINYLARGMSKDEWLYKLDDIKNIDTEYDKIELEQEIIKLTQISKHWVPFTHTGISLRMEAPIPIRTQAFKHKIGFTESEESRRYINSRPEFYIPEFRVMGDNIKQGSLDTEHDRNSYWKNEYISSVNKNIDLYMDMINNNIPPEQARFILPQGVEVNWIWTGNLASFARYYLQRSDPHAQKESKILAEQVSEIIKPLFPVSWKALITSGRVFNVDEE